MKNYLVWFDPEIHEVLAIEKEYMTDGLKKQLEKEQVKIFDYQAENLHEATEIFLEKYEENNKMLHIVDSKIRLH